MNSLNLSPLMDRSVECSKPPAILYDKQTASFRSRRIANSGPLNTMTRFQALFAESVGFGSTNLVLCNCSSQKIEHQDFDRKRLFAGELQKFGQLCSNHFQAERKNWPGLVLPRGRAHLFNHASCLPREHLRSQNHRRQEWDSFSLGQLCF